MHYPSTTATVATTATLEEQIYHHCLVLRERVSARILNRELADDFCFTNKTCEALMADYAFHTMLVARAARLASITLDWGTEAPNHKIAERLRRIRDRIDAYEALITSKLDACRTEDEAELVGYHLSGWRLDINRLKCNANLFAHFLKTEAPYPGFDILGG